MRDGFHAAVINALALAGRRRSRFREGTAQYVRSPAGLWFCALPALRQRCPSRRSGSAQASGARPAAISHKISDAALP